MVFQMSRREERLLTSIARVGFLPCVSSHVHGKITRYPECFPARGTDKRLLACVYSHVGLQSTPTTDGLVTNTTREPLVRVSPHVVD